MRTYQDGRRRRPVAEEVEPRRLLSGVTIEPIANVSIPAGKSLILPVRASEVGHDPLTYTVTSSDPSVTATVHTGNPFLKLSVAGEGDMVFELLHDVAPHTVDTIVGLVNSGFYNGLTFHRVVPGFVIQGGDPNANGTGGPGFTFDDEFNPQAIFSGNDQLAMANSGKDTNGSQFFVTFGPQRNLDFNYTIFGQLVRGADVATAISNVPNVGPPSNKPLTTVVITSASIVNDPTDAVLTLNAAANSPGATVTVRADDGQGGTDIKTFHATAVADTTDDPAILGPVGDQTTYQDRPVVIPLTSTDLENDPVRYGVAITDSPAHATTSVAGNLITVTPEPGYNGDIHVTVGAAQMAATSPGSDRYDTQKITIHAVSHPRGVADDFDGDGKTDPAIYRPSTGLWVINPTSGGKIFTNFGDPHQGDIPVPGDYDGDGKTDLAVFRPTTDQWIIRPSSGGPDVIKQFGDPTNGDVPIPGNYEGNGTFDLALFRAKSEQWIIRYADGSTHVFQFGDPAHNDLPVPGDYEGIGKYDLALFRPGTGEWLVRTSDGKTPVSQFGDPAHGDIAVPGDYDGDGKTDLAIFRPGTAQFVIEYSGGGKSPVTQLGDPTQGDLPVNAPLASLGLIKARSISAFSAGRTVVTPAGGVGGTPTVVGSIAPPVAVGSSQDAGTILDGVGTARRRKFHDAWLAALTELANA